MKAALVITAMLLIALLAGCATHSLSGTDAPTESAEELEAGISDLDTLDQDLDFSELDSLEQDLDAIE